MLNQKESLPPYAGPSPNTHHPRGLAAFYMREWEWFKTRLWRIFLLSTAIFLVVSAVSHFYLVGHPDQADSAFSRLAEQLTREISLDGTRWELFLDIAVNNLKVSVRLLVFGLIPFLFLPLIGVVGNGFAVGVVTSMTQLKGMEWGTVLLRIIPHGIIEIPIFLYTGSLGIYLTLKLTNRILAISNWDEEPLIPLLKRILATLVLVIIPLLFLAAFIEAYLTPR